MRFIKIKPELIDFDHVYCGELFNNKWENYEDEIVPQDEECLFTTCNNRSIDDKQEPGVCCIDDCPLGYSASIENMKELCLSVYNEWKDSKDDPVHHGSYWFVQEYKVL